MEKLLIKIKLMTFNINYLFNLNKINILYDVNRWVKRIFKNRN